MQQKACVRIHRSAEMAQRPTNFFDQIDAPDHRSGDNIRMAVEILRATMERQIETDLGRAEIDRTGESIIDNRNQAVDACELNRCAKTGDLHQRIRDGLE